MLLSFVYLTLFNNNNRALYDEKSAARASAGIFTKRDLTDSEAKVFEEFYYVSLNFPYLLSFGNTINNVSDLGDLWYVGRAKPGEE